MAVIKENVRGACKVALNEDININNGPIVKAITEQVDEAREEHCKETYKNKTN